MDRGSVLLECSKLFASSRNGLRTPTVLDPLCRPAMAPKTMTAYEFDVAQRSVAP